MTSGIELSWVGVVGAALLSGSSPSPAAPAHTPAQGSNASTTPTRYHHRSFGTRAHRGVDEDADGLTDLIVRAAPEPPEADDEWWVLSARDGSLLRAIPRASPAASGVDVFWSDPDSRGSTVDAAFSDATWHPISLPGVRGMAFEIRQASSSHGVVVALAARSSNLSFDAEEIDDVDGDGLRDLRVQVRFAQPFAANLASVGVLSRRDGRWLWSVPGVQGRRRDTTSVVRLDDVDCDGVPDVAVSRYDASSYRSDVAILSGKDGSTLRSVFDERVVPRAPAYVHALCDLDGDGIGEVGVTSLDDFVHVFSPTTGSRLFSESRFDSIGDDSGFASALAGFRDADGSPRLLIGVQDASVLSGRVECWSVRDHRRRFDSTDPEVWHVGSHIVVMDDVDGDGTPDFCAPTEHGMCGEPGRVSVFSGRTGSCLWSSGRSHTGYRIDRR